MRRYYIILLLLTLVLELLSFALLWSGSSFYAPIIPFIVLYFTIVTGVEHHLIVKSFQKDPRTFVKGFMGLTVGTLLLHLVVMTLYMFTHLQTARLFVIAFCVCYVIYLVFETISLVALVRRNKN